MTPLLVFVWKRWHRNNLKTLLNLKWSHVALFSRVNSGIDVLKAWHLHPCLVWHHPIILYWLWCHCVAATLCLLSVKKVEVNDRMWPILKVKKLMKMDAEVHIGLQVVKSMQQMNADWDWERFFRTGCSKIRMEMEISNMMNWF